MSFKKSTKKRKTDPKKKQNLADYIEPLCINGLKGRVLRLPPPAEKKREILIIYGHHASIERMFGVAEFFNQYGGVTLPDLPGFGGMEPFYKIDEKPTLDNLADYLVSFIKLRYKRRRFTIMATSFGFVIVTHMLQRYPELAKKVDMLVSFAGFVHKNDFKLKRLEYLSFRWLGSLCSNRLPALLFKHLVFRPTFIRLMYTFLASRHTRLKDTNKDEQRARIEFEISLWLCNDIRTRGDTVVTFMTVDLCNKQIDLPVYHIAVDNDHYFDNQIVKQHLKVIYKKVYMMRTPLSSHTPTVIADAAAISLFVPQKLRYMLAHN